MKELTNTINRLGFKKAHQFYLNKYKKFKKDKDLLYLILIELEFIEELKIDDEIIASNLFALAYCKDDSIFKKIATPALLCAIELENYYHCYNISKRAIKLNMQSFNIYLGAVLGLYYFKKDIYNKKIEEYIIKLNNELDNLGKIDYLASKAYLFETKYYLTIKNYKKADEITNLSVLTLDDNLTKNYINLLYNIVTNEQNPDLLPLKQIKDTSLFAEYSFFIHLFDIYYYRKDYLKSYRILEHICNIDKIENEVDIYPLKRKMIECLIYVGKITKGISILEKEDLKTNADANFFLGKLHSFRGYKLDLEKAIPYYKQAFKISKQYINLIEICQNYLALQDFDKANKVYLKIKENKDLEEDILSLSYSKYMYQQDFNNAYKVAKQLYKKDNNEENLCNLLLCTSSSHEFKKLFKLRIKKYFSTIDHIAYLCAGVPTIKKDKLKAKQLADKYLKDNPLDTLTNQTLLLLAYAYLDIDNKMYLNLLEKGYYNYTNLIDGSIQVVVTLAYSYYYGIGVKLDRNKTKELLDLINEKSNGVFCTKLVQLHAQISLDNNSNLEYWYNQLLKSNETRYDLTSLYLLIELGKRLNKDIKQHKKEFKKAFKLSTDEDKLHYMNNPSHIILNY